MGTQGNSLNILLPPEYNFIELNYSIIPDIQDRLILLSEYFRLVDNYAQILQLAAKRPIRVICPKGNHSETIAMYHRV